MAKNKLAIIVGIAVVLFLTLTVIKSCGIVDKYSELTGQYNALKALYDKDTAILTEEIAHKNECIAQIDAENEILLETRIHQEQQVALLNAQLERLIYVEPDQPELESEPLVINLRAQIAKMSLVVNEQANIINNNDEIIFNLTQKYKSQLIISTDYKKLLDNEVELHILAVERIDILENRIRGLRFGSTVKTVGVLAGVGAVAYLLLRGN